jgi:hypothetical protein
VARLPWNDGIADTSVQGLIGIYALAEGEDGDAHPAEMTSAWITVNMAAGEESKNIPPVEAELFY